MPSFSTQKEEGGAIVHIRRLIAFAMFAAFPRIAAAQFTTFIQPQSKVEDSVKTVVAAQQKAEADSVARARITNMKTWVDSAAGVLPSARSRLDSLHARARADTTKRTDSVKVAIVPPTRDTVPFPNGARAPETASSLPLIAFAGAFALIVGAFLVCTAKPARDRA
jgi:hypothetical protein